MTKLLLTGEVGMNYYTERPINDHLHGLPPSDIVSGVSFVSAASQISNYVFKHYQTFAAHPAKVLLYRIEISGVENE